MRKKLVVVMVGAGVYWVTDNMLPDVIASTAPKAAIKIHPNDAQWCIDTEAKTVEVEMEEYTTGNGVTWQPIVRDGYIVRSKSDTAVTTMQEEYEGNPELGTKTVRRIAKETFDQLGKLHEDNAIAWHWWKRAYDSAYHNIEQLIQAKKQ